VSDRGRLLKPSEVRARFFAGPDGESDITERWILKHVKPRVNLARGVVRFYEGDVEAFLESRRAA
jgi:hypothetical protein